MNITIYQMILEPKNHDLVFQDLKSIFAACQNRVPAEIYEHVYHGEINAKTLVESMDEFLYRYAEPVPIHKSGYPVFMLKTVGAEDECIFLEDNKCTVHAVKPRACRTYPVETGPDARGGYVHYLSKEQPHHFSGPQTTVKRWLGRYLSNTDRAFVEEDTGSAKEMALLLGELQELYQRQAMILFLFYRYSSFDLDKAFLPQFLNNNRELKKALKNLAWKKDLPPKADLKNLNSGKQNRVL